AAVAGRAARLVDDLAPGDVHGRFRPRSGRTRIAPAGGEADEQRGERAGGAPLPTRHRRRLWPAGRAPRAHPASPAPRSRRARRYRRARVDAGVGEAFTRLVELMARLRAPGGCPWDREQTSASLRPYLLEEVYEVLEAIDAGDAGHLRDELGDLLLQIVFQSQLASEAGRFTIADVACAIVDKLVRRHPHVFGDVEVRDAGEVVRNWRRIKAEERRTTGEAGDPFAGVPAAPP